MPDYSGKYLDGNGVSHLWAKIKATFALISHTHTKSQITDFPTIPGASSTTPKMDGTAAVGSETAWAKGDHVHPTDTSRAAASHAHGNITSGGDITATAPTVASGDKLVINDESASKITNGPSFGGDDGTFLSHNGTWKTPAGTTYADYNGSYSDLVPLWVPISGMENTYSFTAMDAHGVWRTVGEMVQNQLDTGEEGGADGFVVIDGSGDLSVDSSGSLMTSAEKTKLAGIAAGAQVNSITGVKGNSESSYRTGNVNLTAANIGAAASSHAHGNITSGGDITAAAPTVASGDKLIINDESASKVTNGPSFGTSTSTYLRNDGTWGTPTGTTYSDFTGATASAAGSRGLVPAPGASDYKHMLFGDGGWKTLYLAATYDTQTESVEITLYKGSASTENGITSTYLGAASVYGVDSSIASGSTSGNLPTSAAVAAAINAAMSDVAGALVYKGTVGTGGTVTDLPASHTKGWYYVVSTAGTYAGKTCEVGDMLICNTTGTTANNAHWDAVQSNITALTTTEIDAIVAAA